MPLDNNARELVKRGNKLFSEKDNYNSLCQVIAENSYPERANFTSELMLGEDFASHLYESSPILMRRDLGNAFSSMLRPRGQPWFSHDVEDEDLREEDDVREHLERITKIHRKALYKAQSRFIRATKEADHDFAAFGGPVLSCEENARKNGLVFHCYHPRDCAYAENLEGEIDTLFRNVSMTARQMKQRWGDGKLHRDVQKACEKEPDKAFKVRHTMMPVADYEYRSERKSPKGAEYVSIYVDVDHEEMISEAPSFEFRYVVPRWQTLSGFVYPVSPAAMVAIPDMRMIQALARIIQEAGEKSVDPPMKGKETGIRGEVNLYASGITWVDAAYNEKEQGAAIEAIQLGKNPGLGVEMLERTRLILTECWYLNKLSLPQQGAKTAFETAQLVEEFIRSSIPLFEPMETTYNVPLLDMSAQVLQRVGAFGSVEDLPDALSGEETVYSFSNPLQEAIKKNRVYQFQNAAALTTMARDLDSNAGHHFDAVEGLRDAIDGSGAPANWLPDKDEADEAVAQAKQAQTAMQAVGGVGAAGEAAEAVGKGGQAIRQALAA